MILLLIFTNFVTFTQHSSHKSEFRKYKKFIYSKLRYVTFKIPSIRSNHFSASAGIS